MDFDLKIYHSKNSQKNSTKNYFEKIFILLENRIKNQRERILQRKIIQNLHKLTTISPEGEEGEFLERKRRYFIFLHYRKRGRDKEFKGRGEVSRTNVLFFFFYIK